MSRKGVGRDSDGGSRSRTSASDSHRLLSWCIICCINVRVRSRQMSFLKRLHHDIDAHTSLDHGSLSLGLLLPLIRVGGDKDRVRSGVRYRVSIKRHQLRSTSMILASIIQGNGTKDKDAGASNQRSHPKSGIELLPTRSEA